MPCILLRLSVRPTIMGCCSKEVVVEGFCCCNSVLEFPCKLGCAQECMTCCLSCKLCCEIGERPLAAPPCCCCGPKCECNSTLCKVKGTVFCLAVQGTFPCSDDTPIICTILPFCTVYPKVGCCHTLDSLGAKEKKKEEEKIEVEVKGAPSVVEMSR